VPVTLEGLLRAVELNGVAVENNKLAFSLGRLSAGDPQAITTLVQAPAPVAGAHETLEEIVARGVAHLTGYQSAAYAQRYAGFVRRVQEREAAVAADPALPFTRAVARSLLKLMAYKDEYEVARLYTDGEFQRALREQFEGNVDLEFYMAPPVLSRSRDGQAPRKVRFGGWMLPALRLLAHGRRLRGTSLDLFGRTAERRLERELIEQYTSRIESLLPLLDGARVKVATDIAALPLTMRGFGHVKLANVAVASAREAELLHRFDPRVWPRPAATRQAGQLRGIPVTSAR